MQASVQLHVDRTTFVHSDSVSPHIWYFVLIGEYPKIAAVRVERGKFEELRDVLNASVGYSRNIYDCRTVKQETI